MLARLLFWDKILIIAFTIFSIVIIAAIIYVNVPLIQLWTIRKLNEWISKLEAFNSRMSDWNEYDPEWMEINLWEETNI